ncbi:DUF2345 domain-containing protein [Burkholderia metallica]|uniref:DUF2345 domain-containing protein n=1 Tax=Burkholderia metallica TaxID=488729 RepID=A0ABT8PHK7_9BURK|nr:DUF2345 domain-containing protein [Burkholderia metallica]MDN7934629.1 DUF2345 domain-containing protein [Burkholderia metallica]
MQGRNCSAVGCTVVIRGPRYPVTSNQSRVTIEATVEIILKCGGSYIRLNADGIEDGTRGARTIRPAAFSREGPSSVIRSAYSKLSSMMRYPATLVRCRGSPSSVLRGPARRPPAVRRAYR